MRIGVFAPAFKRFTARPGCLIAVDARGRRTLLPRAGWTLSGLWFAVVEKPASEGLAWVLRSWRGGISEEKREWYKWGWRTGQARASRPAPSAVPRPTHHP